MQQVCPVQLSLSNNLDMLIIDRCTLIFCYISSSDAVVEQSLKYQCEDIFLLAKFDYHLATMSWFLRELIHLSIPANLIIWKTVIDYSIFAVYLLDVLLLKNRLWIFYPFLPSYWSKATWNCHGPWRIFSEPQNSNNVAPLNAFQNATRHEQLAACTACTNHK